MPLPVVIVRARDAILEGLKQWGIHGKMRIRQRPEDGAWLIVVEIAASETVPVRVG